MSTKRYLRAALIGLGVVVAAIAAVGVASAVRDDGSTTSTASVYAFAEPDREVGASTLERYDDRVTSEFDASSTPPNEAYTLWWVVFNDPQACVDECDAGDLFIDGDPSVGLNDAQIDAADIVAAYATGDVSTADGTLVLQSELDANEPAGTREIIFGEGATLKDPGGAEVHLVARSHGPAIDDIVDEQIGSFGGGCDVFLNPPSQPSAVGECADVLFAVHTP
ncbi:MAG: hypothetical protein AAGA42_18800 [Actinomycetota bacterium]